MKKKYLWATPAYDGKLDMWYVNSLLQTIKIAHEYDVEFYHLFVANDALVQRARNDIFSIAANPNSGFDGAIFVDSDMEWQPEWPLELALREEDVVGGTCRKKTDKTEQYVTSINDFTVYENGLMKAIALGFGFVKFSKRAIEDVWNVSQPYENEGKICRMVCDVQVVEGILYGEDTVVYAKLQALGYDVWLDPKMTLSHIGTKKFEGNFIGFVDKWIKSHRQCRQCGISYEITPKIARTNKLYCTNACRSKAYRGRKNELVSAH